MRRKKGRNKMIYGYARVSTKGQAKDGNSLEYQENVLREQGAEVIYKEAYTGTKKSRPELDKCIAAMQEGDMLIVTKLDRFARSVKNGLEIADMIAGKGCTLKVLNMGSLGIFDNTPSGKMMRTVMLAFSEFERDMIVQRTNEGKEIAKAVKGDAYKEGRKPVSEEIIRKIQEGVPYTELGISQTSWYKYRKAVMN